MALQRNKARRATPEVNGSRGKRSKQRTMELEHLVQVLEISNAGLGSVLAKSADALMVVNREGAVCFANPAVESVLNVRAQKIIGQPFGLALVPDELVEIDIVHNGGDPGTAEMRADEIVWDGEAAHLISLRDITERKRYEAELTKLSRAVAQSPTIITDADGNIEYVNPKFTRVTGYSLDEVIGENPRLLKSGETPAGEYRRLWDAMTSGEEWSGELRNRKKNGELYWVSASVSAVRNDDGVTTHFIGVPGEVGYVAPHR